jgi:uncharacterized membrane protein
MVILGTFEGATGKAHEYVERFDAIKDEIALLDVVGIVRVGDQPASVEHRGVSRGKSAGTGAVIGGLVGLLAGPAGVALGAAAGGALGAAVSGLSHVGIPKVMLERAEAGMPENSSAVLVVMEAARSDVVINDLKAGGATVIHHSAESGHLEQMPPPGQAYSEQ